MIKAGILGGSSPMAGELIRLLINHPDVEIIWVDSVRYNGRLVSDVHHGLLGETELRFSASSASLDDIDVLFIFRNKGQTTEWLDQHDLPDDLRIVDMSVDMRDAATASKYGFVYGLPELNRKAMVRGAKRAIVPHPAALIAELALLPLVKAGEIDGDIAVKVVMPQKSEQVVETADLATEILRAVQELQPEMNPKVTVAVETGDVSRALDAQVQFDTAMDIGEIYRAYEEFYDDHNFVFLSNQPANPKEVEGTNKCIMHIDKHNARVTITTVMDGILKGAAGTAVHDMNLLFGLHERVGLALKASIF